MNERSTLKNVNGSLEIGGVDCAQLIEKYGTPLYVMDQTYIENMCEIYSKTLRGLVCTRGN